MNSGWRKHWLLAVLLIGLVSLIFLLTMLTRKGMQAEPFTNRSVYNNDASGYRAWYLASRKAGLPMGIWQKPFREIETLPAPTAMLIVEPLTVANTRITFGPEDTKRLLRWVSQGNTLILLDDFNRRGAEVLLRRLGPGLEAKMAEKAPEQVNLANPPAIIKSYLAAPLLTESKRWLSFSAQAGKVRVVLQDPAGRPLMVRFPYGNGTIMLGTPVDLGSNHYLHGKPNDNFQFLSNLLVLERKPVFINEFVHGFNEIDNIFAYFQQRTPLGAIFIQLMFGFVFLLWLSFVSWVPRPAEVAGGLERKGEALSSNMEAFMDSLAGIYLRTRSASMALEPQLARIEATLRKRYRVSLEEEAKVQHLLAGFSGEYSNRDSLREVPLWESLKKARETVRRRERLQNRELLKLSRQLSILQERLEARNYGQGSPIRRR